MLESQFFNQPQFQPSINIFWNTFQCWKPVLTQSKRRSPTDARMARSCTKMITRCIVIPARKGTTVCRAKQSSVAQVITARQPRPCLHDFSWKNGLNIRFWNPESYDIFTIFLNSLSPRNRYAELNRVWFIEWIKPLKAIDLDFESHMFS